MYIFFIYSVLNLHELFNFVHRRVGGGSTSFSCQWWGLWREYGSGDRSVILKGVTVGNELKITMSNQNGPKLEID